MVKKYYDTICTISRKWINIVRWSQVETITDIYVNIWCAIYKQLRNWIKESVQAIETDTNAFHMVVDSPYTWIVIWDIVTINNLKYQVSNTPLANTRSNWIIDNYEFDIKKTT